MWLNKAILNDDLESCSNVDFIPWKKLQNKSILITGATGLIGFNLVCALLYTSKKFNLNLKVIAQIRDEQKAKRLFADFLSDKSLEFHLSEIENKLEISSNVDYIIHGANPTTSEYFIKKPVELINTITNGTINILDFAKEKKAKCLYLSTMEVYGAHLNEERICENAPSLLDNMTVRSSYPQAKKMSETLCASYASEYGIDIFVARLAQTFGPGVYKNDNRVFADFARCIEKGQNIVLQTAGTSKRPCIYTMDAVSAILCILLKGKSGEAYNVANEQNYCSIKHMAKLLATELADGKISVIIPDNGEHDQKFPPPHALNLSTDKLKKLGWNSKVLLIDMFKRMMGII